jgi:hypothetical protein
MIEERVNICFCQIIISVKIIVVVGQVKPAPNSQATGSITADKHRQFIGVRLPLGVLKRPVFAGFFHWLKEFRPPFRPLLPLRISAFLQFQWIWRFLRPQRGRISLSFGMVKGDL